MAIYHAYGYMMGIGAQLIPLIGDKRWRVLPSFEDRDIHTRPRNERGQCTFEHNFKTHLSERLPDEDVTLMAGHPKCGGFSSLYNTGRRSTVEDLEKYGDGLRRFMAAVRDVDPDVFYMDNLVKSLLLITHKDWRDALPDYHLSFEWVSNFHYGNPQKGRNRLFVVGVRKGFGFRFTPREQVLENPPTVKSRIGDLVGELNCRPNHHPYDVGEESRLTNLADGNTWEDVAALVRELECGENLPYRAQDGSIKRRIGSNKLHWDKHSHTLAGIHGAKLHPLTGFPITIRERCRLQGYPDNFIICGEKLRPDGTWRLKDNALVVRQLNNTVPLEFCSEFIRQLNFYLSTGRNQKLKPSHVIKTSPYIHEVPQDAHL